MRSASISFSLSGIIPTRESIPLDRGLSRGMCDTFTHMKVGGRISLPSNFQLNRSDSVNRFLRSTTQTRHRSRQDPERQILECHMAYHEYHNRSKHRDLEI